MTPTLQKIDKAMTTLVLDQPFFAVLAMRLQQVESKEIPTFATDGKRLLVNPDFCAKLSDKEIVTILAHEVLHCALGHIWRMPTGADMKTWNLATDNETNWELERANVQAGQRSEAQPFQFPKVCPPVKEDRFKDWAAERIYKVLAEEKAQQQDGQDGEDPQDGQQGKGQGKGKGKGKGKPQQGNGQGQGDDDKPGMGDIIPVPKDEQEKTRQEWERAIVQAEKVARQQERGHVPGSIKELIEKITDTKVDWKALLRDFVSMTAKEDYSFSRPNSRFESTGFLMPSFYNEKVGNIVFAVDTSGSISSELLAEYIAEAQLALDSLNPEKLTLIYCDAEVQHVAEFQPGDIIPLESFGRGGTDFRPVFSHFEKADELPKVLVYLTDLYGEFPTEAPDYPVLWVTETKGGNAPFGDVIEV